MTRTRRPKAALGLASSLLVAVVVACAAQQLPSGETAASAGASAEPEATGTTSRTTDSAGPVDPAGRTADETGRTTLSGMRATEVGGERFTGTPGSGFALPIEPSPERSLVGEGAGQSGPPPNTSPAGLPPMTVVGRLARARCDRELVCGQIGPTGDSPSDGACMAQERSRGQATLMSVDCTNGIDPVQLETCLNAVRGQTCEGPLAELGTFAACDRGGLCASP